MKEQVSLGDRCLFYNLDDSFKMRGVLTKIDLSDNTKYKYFNREEGEWYRNVEPLEVINE